MRHFPKGGKEDGPSGSVAALVILLMVLGMVLFYLLTVPETQRELLNITGEQHNILDAKPGTIGAGDVGTTEKHTHTLETVVVDNTPRLDAKTLQSQITVKQGVLTEGSVPVSFEIKNKDTIAWAKIEGIIKAREGKGDLIFALNGKEIYTGPLGAGSKIEVLLPVELLIEGTNNLVISTSSPGWIFWSANAYLISDLSLVLGKYDAATAKVSQIASISESELTGVDRIQFAAYVKQLSDSPAKVNVYVNGVNVFEGVPPSSFNLDIATNLITVGSNVIEWEVEQGGKYQIGFAKIVVSAADIPATAKKYDFTISSSLWEKLQADALDCELLLQRDETKSAGDDITIRLNAKLIKKTFTNNEIVLEDICEELEEGQNSVSLSATKDIYIEKIKITLKE